MQTNCDACGDPFEAKRAAAKYCGDRCRKRAQRQPKGKPKGATVVALVPTEPFETENPQAPAEGPAEGPTTAATRRQLAEAGRLDTALGVAALIAAIQVDELLSLRSAETGSGVKALLEAHRTALAEAVKDAKTAEDPLSKIRAAAALKLVQGGRS